MVNSKCWIKWQLNTNKRFWYQWTFSPRRSHLYELITIGYKDNFDYYSILSLFFQSFSYGGFFTLYISSWIILILHLLIIWAFTWVPIPLDTLSGFLWVVVVKATLFKGLLNINAAKKVVTVHSMRWQQLSKIFLRSHHPWMFMIHIFIIGASWKVIMIITTCKWDLFIMSKEIFLLRPSSHLYFAHWVLGLNHPLPFTRPQIAQFSVKAQGPIRDLGP